MMPENHIAFEQLEPGDSADPGHLSECEECRRRWEGLRFLRYQAGSLPRIDPPPFFAARVARLAESAAVPVWYWLNRVARILTPALGALTLLVIALSLGSRESDPSTDESAQVLLSPIVESEVTLDDVIIPAAWTEEDYETPR